MRPLLVLILVLGALGALILALDPFNSGTPSSSKSLSNTTGSQVDADAPGPQQPVDLVGDETSGSRAGASDQTLPGLSADGISNADTIEGEGNLAGSVIDMNGNGIADANVTLTRASTANWFFAEDAAPDRTKDVHTKTNANGQFLFENVEAYDGYALVVRHLDYSPIEQGHITVFEGKMNTEQPITLVPGVRLFGIVRDVEGNRVEGATMNLRPTVLAGSSGGADDPNIVIKNSDSEGNFRFPNLATGNYLMTVTADGYGTVAIPQINIGLSEDVERDVTLMVAMALGGQVVDSKDQPVQSVEVMAFSIGDRNQRTQTQTKTDADGNWIMQDVPEGSYAVRAKANGYRVASVMRAEAGDMNIQIRLESLPRISGVVIDAVTGQPLRRFALQLRRADQSPETSVKIGRPQEFTDENGEFSMICPIQGNRPGTYMVGAAATGYAISLSDTMQVEQGQDVTGVKILCTPGGRIRGRITDSKGRPVPKAKITTRSNQWTGGPFDIMLGDSFPGVASKVTIRTNDKGEFMIPNLTKTTYLIMIEPTAHAKRAMKHIEVSDGQETDVGDVIVNTGATVSGTVRGPSGAPLPGSVVSLQGESLGQEYSMSLSSKTDANGRYQIEHINPGAYFISAVRPSASGQNDPFANANDQRKTRRRITLDEGRTNQGEDFDLPN
jgi:protocatechuate 3,4-dioxygenase beta subunit/5-hydroxyisourate hydrolase-like protein (transthyretin family)